MTKYEIMVIAAAAAAFVIINIIMWSIIAVKEKRAARKEEQRQPTVQNPGYTAIPEVKQQMVLHSVPERPHVKRSDFILLDDIVIVHTDERI